MHAFIVVIIYSSADCKTERTIVHEKHNSPKRNPSYIFTVSGIIYILYIYNIYSCLWLMSWLMTNDMRVIVERGALSAVSACSVSESYFKTLSLWRDSDRVQRFFFSSNFIFWAPWDGGWSSGYDCVLSPCSSLTVIWKVPLVKYSGLPGLNTELWWSAWVGSYCARRVRLSPGECISIWSRMWAPCSGNVDDRYGTKTRQQSETTRSTSVQVMREGTNRPGLFFKLVFVLKQQNWWE